MPETENQAPQEAAGGLPFEPLTLIIGLLRRWKIMVIFFVVSLTLGVFAGVKFGTRIFEAQSVMLYTPKEGKEQGQGRTPPLSTQIHMVKINANLAKVREKLQLPASLKALGKACNVYVEKKTALVFIKAKWDNPRTVADIVNTLRDVFIQDQLNLAKKDAGAELHGLENRFNTVSKGLKKADDNLQSFISKNKIVDLDMEIRWNLEQMTSLELLLSNARVDSETLGLQRIDLKSRIEALKVKAQEETESHVQTDGLADLNIRIERIRRAIHDDKTQRSSNTLLIKYKLAYERAQKLYEKGLISKAEYEEIRADFEKAEVDALDTEQIHEWKRQLKQLEKQVIPEKANFQSPTGQMVQNLELRELSMDLEGVSLRQKVIHLEREKKRVNARLDVLTDLQRKYAELHREVVSREGEKQSLEKKLARVRMDYESDVPEFNVISEASPPLFSVKSNRKMIMIAIIFLGNMIGFTLILGLELMDTTIKSGAELTQKFSLPVLGVIPKIKDDNLLFPDGTSFPLVEEFRIIVRRLRHIVPKRGARIMIVSINPGEGRTMVTANLAAALGRQDERVLILDAQVRPDESERTLSYLIAEKDKPILGIGEYLSFQAEDAEEIIWPTTLPGVECIPHVGEAVIPDVLASNRMKDMLEEMSKDFSIVLIDSPSADPYVDAELIAEMSDAILFVVRSRACPSSALKHGIERFKESDIPVIGFILNDVDRLYINRI